jgi:hypothetical protein
MNKTIPSQFVHEVGEMVEGCVILEKPVVIPLVPIRCLQVLLGQFARPTQCVPVSHYLSDNPHWCAVAAVIGCGFCSSGGHRLRE